MTLTPRDGLIETALQRTRDQYQLLDDVHGKAIIVDSDDVADFDFICSSEHLLVPPPGGPGEDAVSRLVRYFNEDREGDFEPTTVDQQPVQERVGMSRRVVPPTRIREPAPDGKDVLATLAEIDLDLGVGFARPDHLVHICGKGLICPATEPAETGYTAPWPSTPQGWEDVGEGVVVKVIDTGYDPATNILLDPNGPDVPANRLWPWLTDVAGDPEPGGMYLAQPGGGPSDELRAYAGHGTFVAGVIKTVAPKCSVEVLNLVIDRTVSGGGVLESDLVNALYDALELKKFLPKDGDGQGDDEPAELPVLPHLINMSAGCPSRLNVPLASFESLWGFLETYVPNHDVVLVAAAGNSANPWSFWPASFEWAVGVGSIDHDGRVSDFSNWGDSVDVYARGRNIINAFPNGTYTCHETPDRDDLRRFVNGRARWSGTSFSAPLVTGMIAAQLSRQSQPWSVQDARDEVLRLPNPAAGDLLLRRTVHAAPRARPSKWVKVATLP
jgi:hypothetical protein